MKKILLRLLAVIIIVSVSIILIQYDARVDSRIVTNLKGRVIYLKRDNSILKLYTSNANMQNKKLLYSHEGKGGDNDNIHNFYYDNSLDLIYFYAMNNGEWALFSIPSKGGEASFVNKIEENEVPSWNYMYDEEYPYLKLQYNDTKLTHKGDMYLINKENNTLLLERSISDKLFNMYYAPTGFSPDGKYVVYRSSNELLDLLGIGTEKKYILEMETKKISKYIDFYRLIWIDE